MADGISCDKAASKLDKCSSLRKEVRHFFNRVYELEANVILGLVLASGIPAKLILHRNLFALEYLVDDDPSTYDTEADQDWHTACIDNIITALTEEDYDTEQSKKAKDTYPGVESPSSRIPWQSLWQQVSYLFPSGAVPVEKLSV